MTARLVGPHLWVVTLFDELVGLGFGASYQPLAREIRTPVSGSVAATCRYYGISYTVFYRWKKRSEDHVLAGLKARSSAPMQRHR